MISLGPRYACRVPNVSPIDELTEAYASVIQRKLDVTHPSKRKGDGFEREVVATLQEHGIAAEKIPLSGAVKGGSFEGDINCPVQGEDWKLECKRRRSGFKTLYGFLGENQAVVVRDDHCDALVVLRLDRFARLAAISRGSE